MPPCHHHRKHRIRLQVTSEPSCHHATITGYTGYKYRLQASHHATISAKRGSAPLWNAVHWWRWDGLLVYWAHGNAPAKCGWVLSKQVTRRFTWWRQSKMLLMTVVGNLLVTSNISQNRWPLAATLPWEDQISRQLAFLASHDWWPSAAKPPRKQQDASFKPWFVRAIWAVPDSFCRSLHK